MSLATRTCGGRAARAAGRTRHSTHARRDRGVYIQASWAVQQRPFTPRRPVNAEAQNKRKRVFTLHSVSRCVDCGLRR
eukprot:scaffold69199_cov54-Phaeocystis_antarctica.AAC.1